MSGRVGGYCAGMPDPDAPERTDHDDPEMYRHSDDPEPDAGEGTQEGGTAGPGGAEQAPPPPGPQRS